MHGEFRQVFAVREFQGLWVGSLLSRGGDQLTRVALAVIAYQRTGSPALTAVVYALTLLPGLLGGPLLGWLADRYSRRDVMIACDAVRTVLIALVAVPGIPLWLLGGLVFASQLLESPSRASRIAMLPDVLPASVYATGVAVNHLTSQLLSLIGFAAGGVVVALAGPSVSLLIDSGTFALCALVTLSMVRRRPAARRGTASWLASTRGGFRLITGSPPLRSLLGLALLAAFHVIPEAIAVPYASFLGLGTLEAGFMMAALPVGNVVGVYVLTKYAPVSVRLRWMGPMAVLGCAPLLAGVLHPGLFALLVLWTVTGVLTAYQVSANAEFVRVVPNEQRGQAVGLASSALTAAQGLGVVVGGLLVQWTDPPTGLAIAGAAGLLVGLLAALAWRRAHTSTPSPA